MRGHEGRVAVVTGAARGIGRAVCRRLAEDGVDVVAVDLTNPMATLADITASGRRGLGHVADVSDPAMIAGLADAVDHAFGRCDILVNNAGIYPVKAFDDLTFEEWRQVLAVNLDSMFLTAKAFVPGMRLRGWGRIVNLTSNTINVQIPGFVHYISSKAGVVGLTRALASETGESGITVNAVAPSLVETPGTTTRSDVPMDVSQEEEFQIIANLQAIKRVQVPEDLLGTVSFLTSDESAFVTAQTIYVDGGWVRV